MSYVLFKGFDRVGSEYPTKEDAIKAIDGTGIWNVCGVIGEAGKIRIISRDTIVK